MRPRPPAGGKATGGSKDSQPSVYWKSLFETFAYGHSQQLQGPALHHVAAGEPGVLASAQPFLLHPGLQGAAAACWGPEGEGGVTGAGVR